MTDPKPSLSFWFRYRGLILQAVLLSAIWLVLSAKFEAIYFFWGALSVGFVLWLSHRLHGVPLPDKEPWGSTRIIIPRLALYLAWMLWQIVKSGVYVAYVIIHPRMPIEPMIVRFRSRQPNGMARVILGNSITLTPGTMTLSIDGDRFTVHALTRDIEEDLVSGEMEAKVARLYGQERKPSDGDRKVEVIKTGRCE
jgi:multicomponent Na+:H+ antiporter subunit E